MQGFYPCLRAGNRRKAPGSLALPLPAFRVVGWQPALRRSPELFTLNALNLSLNGSRGTSTAEHVLGSRLGRRGLGFRGTLQAPATPRTRMHTAAIRVTNGNEDLNGKTPGL